MATLRSHAAAIFLGIAGLLAAGCEPSAPPGGADLTPPSPPSPPGGTTAIPAPAGASAPTEPSVPAAASSLPADLVQKIDALIQSHKDYNAVAEQVENQQAAKDRFAELSAIAQRSSDAHDDVMIGTKQLSQTQMVEFEAYMNQHVTPVWDTRKQHQSRVEALLRQ